MLRRRMFIRGEISFAHELVAGAGLGVGEVGFYVGFGDDLEAVGVQVFFEISVFV